MSQKKPTVITCNESHATEWDVYVKSHPHGSGFHWFGWREVYKRAFGFESIFLAAFNSSGEWNGVLPLLLMQDFFGKKYLVSLPFVSYSGLLCSSAEAGDALVNEAVSRAKELNCNYLQLRHKKRIGQLSAGDGRYVSMVLNTNQSEQKIWETSLEAKTRNQVRKAQNSGLKPVWSNDHLMGFYNIFSLNMKRLGTPVFPYNFFSALSEELNENFELLTIWSDNVPVAGMILISGPQDISFPWAASLPEQKHLCPNNMLYWEAIRHAAKGPYKQIDMGRSTLGTGSHRFKSQWGAIEQNLFYQHFYPEMPNATQYTDKAQKTHKLSIAIWKRLPLSITRILGPYVVRHLPEL